MSPVLGIFTPPLVASVSIYDLTVSCWEKIVRIMSNSHSPLQKEECGINIDFYKMHEAGMG